MSGKVKGVFHKKRRPNLLKPPPFLKKVLGTICLNVLMGSVGIFEVMSFSFVQTDKVKTFHGILDNTTISKSCIPIFSSLKYTQNCTSSFRKFLCRLHFTSQL